MFYIKLNNTTSGNPRFIIECPKELTLEEAKKEFGFKIASEKQRVYIKKTTGGRQTVALTLIVVSYNIEATVKRLEKYTFYSDNK